MRKDNLLRVPEFVTDRWFNAAEPITLAGYREATNALRVLIGSKAVACVPLGPDRYGRTVARCSASGTDIGATMVAAGYSHDYARYSGGAYATLEDDARAARRGLWATCWRSQE